MIFTPKLTPKFTISLCNLGLTSAHNQPLVLQVGYALSGTVRDCKPFIFTSRKNVEDFTGPRERSDLGFITFDITADLENIFDWNVKQLFLYLSAEYLTKNNALNQVVLWDKIVLRGDNPKLLLKDMKTKYFFFDDGNGLKGNRNVTLTLSWNVVPNAGILPLVTGSGHISVPFPDTYEITKSY